MPDAPPQTRQLTAKRSRPPAFTPVPMRVRKGGWSAEVQCAFLAQLYLKGSVAAAARAVGRSRDTAYSLRKRPGASSFAAAWDRILAGPAEPGQRPQKLSRKSNWRKLTLQEVRWRAMIGLWRPVIYRGKMRGIAKRPDNTALLHLIARLPKQTARVEEAGE